MDGRMDRRTTVKQYAPDLSMQGHKNMNKWGYNFSDQVENIVGKEKNCSLRAISPFTTTFSKTVCCWCVKMSIYGGKGQVFYQQSRLLWTKLKSILWVCWMCWIFTYSMVLIQNDWLIFLVFNAIFNSISVISRRPVHLSVLSWSSLNSTPHNILSKLLVAFPHNHCRNNGQL